MSRVTKINYIFIRQNKIDCIHERQSTYAAIKDSNRLACFVHLKYQFRFSQHFMKPYFYRFKHTCFFFVFLSVTFFANLNEAIKK